MSKPFDARKMADILLTVHKCSGPQATLTYCLGIDIVVEACLAELERLGFNRHGDNDPFM